MNNESLSESLKQLVHGLALPGGRMVGSSGHDVAREFLVRRLEVLGCEPYGTDSFELPYSRGGQSFCNLAGVVPGRDRSKKPTLIGAHYDTVIPHPCADDNAAAVAIALEVGRNLTHASDSVENGAKEVALWFTPDELVSWERENDRWIFE